jgi:hypothetical protein
MNVECENNHYTNMYCIIEQWFLSNKISYYLSVNLATHSSDGVKNAWNCISTPPGCGALLSGETTSFL